MFLRPGQTLRVPFVCTDGSGISTAPTGTPTATLYRNGSAQGDTVTVTMSTADGVASVAINSGWSAGDSVYLKITATISGSSYSVFSPSITLQVPALASDALDAAGVRTAVGLASANLDTQLSGIKTVTDRYGTMIVQDGSVYQFTANSLENSASGGGGGLITGLTAAAIAQLAGVEIRLASDTITDSTPLDIVQGCDYSTDDGTAKTWNFTDSADHSASTATLTLKRGATSEEFAGSVADTGDNTWSIEVEITAAQSEALAAGNDWTYSLVLNLANGHTRVIRLPGHRARVLAR